MSRLDDFFGQIVETLGVGEDLKIAVVLLTGDSRFFRKKLELMQKLLRERIDKLRKVGKIV